MLKINTPDITNSETFRYIYTVIVISRYLYLKKISLSYFFFFLRASRKRVITKIKWGVLLEDYIVDPLEIRARKKIMPDLDSRNRGQRFFSVRRKTYVFLRYITDAPFLRKSAERRGTMSTVTTDLLKVGRSVRL